jgi:hypothetical protein
MTTATMAAAHLVVALPLLPLQQQLQPQRLQRSLLKVVVLAQLLLQPNLPQR